MTNRLHPNQREQRAAVRKLRDQLATLLNRRRILIERVSVGYGVEEATLLGSIDIHLEVRANRRWRGEQVPDHPFDPITRRHMR
jgi:hypothetical protein